MEELWGRLGFGTRSLSVFMIGLHFLKLTLFDERWIPYITIIPSQVIKGQVWRLFTSSLFHADIMHLFMNMVMFFQLGASLENTVGTLSLFYHIFVFGILTNLLYIFIAWFMKVSGDSSQYQGSALGFSGILFSLLVIDSVTSEERKRSVLGVFLVDSKFYPIIMLLVNQLLMPQASLLGHASGLIIGYAYQIKLLRFLVPSAHTFSRIEQKICCCCLRSQRYITAEGERHYIFRPYTVFNNQSNESSSDGEDNPPQIRGQFMGEGRTLEISADGMQVLERTAWDDENP